MYEVVTIIMYVYPMPCLSVPYRCTTFITLSGKCVISCDEGFQITVFPNSTLSARVCEGQCSMKCD